jgi:hypothetical protein
MSSELEFPKRFSELTAEEKDEVIELILDHIGRQIETFKWEGDSRRTISLRKPHRRYD